MSSRHRSNSGPPVQMETDNKFWDQFRRSSSASKKDSKKTDSSEKSSENSDHADRVNKAAEALWPKDGGKTPSFFRNLHSLANVHVPDKTRSYVPRPALPSPQTGVLRPASQGQLTAATRQAPPIPIAPPVKHVFTPGTRANVTKALESHVDAAKRRSAHIEQTNSRFADELLADQKTRETSQEKKKTDVFSDEEEIMPPKKQQGDINPDELVGMLEQVNLDNAAKGAAAGAGRGASPMRKPGERPPPPSPGKGRGHGVAPPTTDQEMKKLRMQEDDLVKQYRTGYQHSLMKFETNRAKMDLLQDVFRRPFSQNIAQKVEQIMEELEIRIDDMENQSSRLYHLKRPAEYNEYLQVRKVFDNYFIIATNYLSQPTEAASTIPVPDKSSGCLLYTSPSPRDRG